MQVLVVGAGVVGLAAAREAAMKGHDVIVAESANAIGTGTSSRNSEVIHAGLYYPTGSHRANHCVPGRRMLYQFCESHGVPHKKIGKLQVVNKDADIPVLEKIFKQSQVNGVENVDWLTKEIGQADRRLSDRTCAAPCARQGQLLQIFRQASILAADLSRAGAGRARPSRHARPGGAHALRAGRRMDRWAGLRC